MNSTMPNLDLLRSAAVEVVEVSQRDGLQNDQNLFSTAQKGAVSPMRTYLRLSELGL